MATELAVRQTVARISRTVAMSACVKTSSVIGSSVEDIAFLAPAHDEAANGVELDAPAFRDEGGCAAFLDQHRPIAGFTDRQAVAIQHGDVPLGAGDMHGSGAAHGSGKRTAAGMQPWQLRLIGKAPGGEAIADDLDGAAGRRAIARGIDFGEGVLDLSHAADVPHGNGELERLAYIAH